MWSHYANQHTGICVEFSGSSMLSNTKILERLLAIADEETLNLVGAMIGKPELALLLAKEALKNTTEVLSPTIVAEVLQISRNRATNKIENCDISERPAWDD
jgi:hypothetical protein